MRRAPLAALVVWLALVGACVAVVARAGFSTDLQAFLPAAPTPAQQVLVDQLRDGVVSRLMLIAIEGPDEALLAELSHDVVDALAGDTAFVYVHNGSEDRIEQDGAFLMAHRYLLSPGVHEDRFSVEGLRQALHTQLGLLSSSMGALAGRLIARDPTGEFLGMVEKFEARVRPDTRRGVWFNTAGNRALLIAQTQSPGFDIDGQQAALARVQAVFAEARERSGADVRLIAVGPGVFAAQVRDAIKADAIRVTTAATVAIFGLLLFVLRSLRALGLILVPVATGALAGIAAVSLGFGQVHGITIGFGATLIGESVDYAIHLLVARSASAGGESPATDRLAGIWPTLRLGVMTSVVGSAALLFSGFPGLAQLGLFSIVGLVVALAVTRWVVPVLVPENFGVKRLDSLGPMLVFMAQRARAARVPALLLVAICAAWLVIEGGAVWNDRFESLSPISEHDKALDREIRAELGAPDVRNLIVVHGIDEEATLQIAESVGNALDAVVARGSLAGYDSPARYLPSEAVQRARQQSIPDEARLRQNLAQAVSGMPFKTGVFESFIREVQQAKQAPLLTRAQLASTGLATQVDALLVERRGAWYAILPLQQVAQPSEVAAALSRFDPRQVMLVDLKVETDALYQGYRTQIVTFSVIGAAAIVVLLIAAMRSLRRSLAVVLPIGAALVVTLAVLTAAGVQLTMFHVVAMLLVVGVGSNYTLFFDQALQRQVQAENTYVALAACNLSTVLGFGLIGLAATPVLAAIGTTVAIGAALSLLFGAVFISCSDAGGEASAAR